MMKKKRWKWTARRRRETGYGCAVCGHKMVRKSRQDKTWVHLGTGNVHCAAGIDERLEGVRWPPVFPDKNEG